MLGIVCGLIVGLLVCLCRWVFDSSFGDDLVVWSVCCVVLVGFIVYDFVWFDCGALL